MADRYWVGGTGNWDNTAGSKWALTAEGAGGEAVPTSADAVYLTNNTGHGSVTITATGPNAACASLNCTGYADTLTYSQNLNVYGNVTYSTGMSLGGTSTRTLNIMATGASLTSNGKTHPCGIAFGTGSLTANFSDNWVCSGQLWAASSGTTTLNSNQLSVVGMTMSAALAGTTTVVLTGGTWSGTSGIANPLILDGNVTVSGSVKKTPTGGITKNSGTITTTGSSLEITGACTLNTPGVGWNNVNYTGGTNTLTLNALLEAVWLGWSSTSQPTFAGTAGFTVGSLQASTISSSAKTITFNHLRTYTITSSINLQGSASYRWTLASDDTVALVPIVFSGSTQTLDYVNTTRVNSSGGTKIICPHWTDNDPTHPTQNWATSSGADGSISATRVYS